ncbi:C-GCAxxG-C-C family protein [uncultured Desulfuromusa sp.]|uniref:C-GCAxxG-C-C family protein n=1 Tax=uncultured Desulfuromusa sp. TaxID=219183 RepID=UPI002AA8D0BB|nr:C-GCAxxG-C-C family protein [uncultured Desulfuromusa sp.]
MDRRTAIKVLGLTTGAFSINASNVLAAKEEATNEIPESPYYGPAQIHEGHAMRVRWPYAELDPDEVAQRAYHNYWAGECMYGVTAAVVDTLREEIGGPYHAFPSMASLYGLGGVLGWATLCGALNGAAMVATLIAENPNAVVNDIYAYYTYEKLPDHFPAQRRFPDVEIVRTIANSPLCHASVTNWCKESGYQAFAEERKERCALVDASVARYLVTALNRDFNGEFVAAYPLPESVQNCRSCHGKVSDMQNTRGKMECLACHQDKATDHF